MSKPKRNSIPRKLWLAVRSIYYWPSVIAVHLVRLTAHRYDEWYRITAPWIVNRGYPADIRRRPRPPRWYQFRHRFTFDNENMRFNIDYAIRAGEVKGLALMFAMGAGDYFFTTPMLAALRAQYPGLPIIGFATANAGEVNSPLIAGLLRGDPNINEVRMFDGKQTRRFKNYDYSDAMRLMPPNYLSLPVFGNHLPGTRHRVISMFESFGLESPKITPPPLIHLPASPPPHVVHLLERIKQLCAKRGMRGVAFLQVDARSSHYTYPYADELAAGLCDRGYFVLSASKFEHTPEMSHVIDFNEFAIMDSIHLLKLLREAFADMRIVSVASVFWSVSSAFGIPNLGMQHFIDDAMHNYWYPNITVITHRDYARLPSAARFLATAGDYEMDTRGRAVFVPGFVLECFDYASNDKRDEENSNQPVRLASK